MRLMNLSLVILLAACAGETGKEDDDSGEFGDPDAVADMDGDGFNAVEDCDDTDPSVSPGADELCNGRDDNCNGEIDENPVDAVTVYPDLDGDGYGDAEGAMEVCDPSAFATVAGDCDDTDPTAYPTAPEICDIIDHDCDGIEGLASPCVDGVCAIDIALEPAVVSGSMLYNGSPIIDVFVASREWRLIFIEEDTAVRRSFDFEGSETYEINLFPGTYTVAFELLVRESVLTPVVAQTVVGQGVVVAGDTTFDIAVDTSVLSGSVLYDGEVIEDYQRFDTEWRLRMYDQVTGALRTINLHGGPTYSFAVFDGVYDIDFEVSEDRAVTRTVDHQTRVGFGHVVSGDSVLDIDVRTATLEGSVAYDGAAISNAHDVDAEYRLNLVEVNTGEAISFDMDGAATYSLDVYEGEYDVDFTLEQEDAVARPVPGTTSVASALVVSGTTPLDIDVRTSTVSGSMSYDGAPVLDNPFGPEVQLHLRGVDGEMVSTYLDGGETYELAAYEGTYDLMFELITVDAVEQPVLGERIGIANDLELVGSGTTADISLETATVRGSVLMDGRELIDATSRPEWVVGFEDDLSGEIFELAYEGGEGFDTRVYAGTYDIRFALTEPGGSETWAPGDTVVLRDVAISGDVTQDLEVRTLLLTGSLSYGGEELIDVSPWDTEWQVHATNLETDELLIIPVEGGTDWEARLYPGTYDLDFVLTAETSVGIAVFDRARFGNCITLEL